MRTFKTVFVLILLTFLTFGTYAQNYIQIGTGTVSTSYPPYSVWNYGWYSAIYPQSALGTSKTIDTIAFYCINGPKNFTNQKIYMKHASSAVFSSANYEDPANNGYTLVFTGTINYNGWTKIALTTPFAYNGSDNLIIHYENRSGASNYANFNSTTSSINDNKSAGSDVSFPTMAGYLNPYPSSLPNVRFYYASAVLPATPSNFFPVDLASRVLVDTNLHFTLGANTTSYNLYFSTDSNAVVNHNASARVVHNGVVAGPGNFTYNPAGFMNSYTKYFWLVVAKNSTDSSTSPVLKFRTQEVISAFPYFQGFEDSTVFYPGWYGQFTEWTYESTGTNAIWNTVGGTDPHTGIYCAYASPYSNTSSSSLMTPRIFLTPGNTITFWWRNGAHSLKVSGKDTTYFEISTNGGINWTVLDTLSPSSAQSQYQMAIHDLSPFSGNNVFLRWRYALANFTGSSYTFLDDITIGSASNPAISLNTNSYTFNELYEGGHTHAKVYITNTGAQNLMVTGVTTVAPFSCTYSGTIAPGATDSATILFTGNSAGTYTGQLTFNINGPFAGNNILNLSGAVLAPHPNYFTGFDLTTTLPPHWNKIKSPTDGSNDVTVLATADAYSAPNCLKILNANDSLSPLMAIMPGVTNFDVNILTFYAKTGGAYTQDLVVGLMDDPYDASTFVPDTSLTISGSYAKYTVTFDTANSLPYIAFRHAHNGKWTSFRIDDVTWNDTIAVVPNCASVLYPADNQQHVDIMMPVILNWAGNGGAPDGYKVYFGTNSNPSVLIKDTSGTGTKIMQTLNFSTTYYWKVIAYNTNGDATGCSVWSFRTMDDPIVTPPFCEDFDSDSAALVTVPLGWSYENLPSQIGQTFMGLCWDMITSNQLLTHSAPNVMSSGPEFYEKNNWLFTPPLALQGGTPYDVSFWYAMEQLFAVDVERMRVVLCTSNHATTAIDTLWYNDSIVNDAYVQENIVFTAPAAGTYYIAFQACSPYIYPTAENNILLLDDVCVQTGSGIEMIDPAFGIYPNPSEGRFVITRSPETGEKTELCVINALGQTIHHRIMNNTSEVIDLGACEKGVYLVRIISDGRSFVRKLVIQ